MSGQRRTGQYDVIIQWGSRREMVRVTENTTGAELAQMVADKFQQRVLGLLHPVTNEPLR